MSSKANSTKTRARLGLGTVVLAAAIWLALSDPAGAWGPGMHVSTAGTVLTLLPALPAAVAALLRRHRSAFLYGALAADVVFAKRLSRVKQFCHHWSTGFNLWHGATNDAGRALSLGYLAHLAADTVAHGKYIPHQLAAHRGPLSLAHFYWELRAEQSVPAAIWPELNHLLRLDHRRHHAVLAEHLSRALLPYPVNRMLFGRINALAQRPELRRAVQGWATRWGGELPAQLMGGYHGEVVDRIVSVLTEMERSAVLREDPSGTGALMQAAVRQRDLRRLRRAGLPIAHQIHEARRSLAPRQGPPASTASATAAPPPVPAAPPLDTRAVQPEPA